GRCWVSRLAFEPRVAVQALTTMTQPFVDAGRLRILTRTKIVAADEADDRIQSVLLFGLDTKRWTRVHARVVIDATELGDVLPLAGVEYRVGAESRDETGEPHAQPAESKPDAVQSFTYTFVLEKGDPGARHVIPKPSGY